MMLFSFEVLPKSRSLADLSAVPQLFKADIRKNAHVLIVDDKPVPQVETLVDRGINVKSVKDVENFDFVMSYDVILCDIRGVGARFQSHLEGAYVAKKIKELYPFKKVGIITGEMFDERFHAAMKTCDRYFRKDASTDDWEEEISSLIDEVCDPVKQWKVLRQNLLNADVPILLVYKLEQRYIKAVQNRNPAIFSEQKLISGIDPVVKSMIAGFVKSAIFKSLAAAVV